MVGTKDDATRRALTEVLLVEDDALVVDAIREALAQAPDTWKMHACVTLAAGRAALANRRFGVALVDLCLPDGSGLSLLPPLRAAGVVVVVLSALADERTVYAALGLGAAGYLHKPEGIAAIADALRDALEGDAPMSPKIARWLVRDLQARASPDLATDAELTPREREVLEHFASGASYAEVASALGIGVNTVRSHVRHVYEKLGVSTKTEAVIRGLGR